MSKIEKSAAYILGSSAYTSDCSRCKLVRVKASADPCKVRQMRLEQATNEH